MAATLESDIVENGMTQGDLVRYLQNVRDVVNELQTDHATIKTFIDECKTDIDAAVADITAMRAAIVGITAKLDADSGVTDVNYASSWDPAAQTSTSIAAAAVATLTNSTALKLTGG